MSRLVPQSRAERLIAAGRFVLAVASFGAIWLDPLEPSRYPTFTYVWLGIYAVYAAATVVRTEAAPAVSRRGQVASHLIDLVFFGVINFVTLGPTSPFFVYFVFSILCAMLRFGRRGTIFTACAAAFVFVATGASRIGAAEFELNRFIIRLTYLLVVASMLVYLAAYQERVQHDLQRIARWPRSLRPQQRELVAQLLEEAMSIFGARRSLLVYQHLGEHFAWFADASSDRVECTAEPTEIATMLLENDSGTYVSSAAFQAAPLDFDDSVARREKPRSTRGIPEEIVKRYAIDDVVSTSFKGDFVRGQLVLLDGRLPLLEELNLARIAGGVIAGRLDHFHATQQLQRGAVAEERVRLARDLHDSVLQSLTGIALQLRTLPRLMAQNPDEGQQRFSEIEQVLVSTQKELRWFIDQLRPGRVSAAYDQPLDDRLLTLAQRFRDPWALEVSNEVAPVVHLLPIRTRHEIYAIVSEAVANAAKHATAKRVAVAIDVDGEAVRIDIVDDGHGFPFHGRYDLRTLVAEKRGPVTLKERIGSLGGSLVINSSPTGAHLEIRLPLQAIGAHA